jgi:multicomponent Na+:H+ antiporter subunit C
LNRTLPRLPLHPYQTHPMAEFLWNTIGHHFNYWVYLILLMMGLWAAIAKNNLVKKLMGLSIFQSAIILLYVSIGTKEGATIPILDHHGHLPDPVVHTEEKFNETPVPPTPAHLAAQGVANPLPHVLMLTAIVVGVATLGVALALVQAIYREFGTVEEDELLREIKALHPDG